MHACVRLFVYCSCFTFLAFQAFERFFFLVFVSIVGFSAAHFHFSLLLYVCVTPFELLNLFVVIVVAVWVSFMLFTFVLTNSSVINLQICL